MAEPMTEGLLDIMEKFEAKMMAKFDAHYERTLARMDSHLE
jgi:hypothetical protein